MARSTPDAPAPAPAHGSAAPKSGQPTIVRPHHVVGGMLWLGLFVGGSLGQIWLRFNSREAEINARKAQEQMVALRDTRLRLESEVIAARSRADVRERAQAALSMDVATPDRVARLDVPASLYDKYRSVRIPQLRVEDPQAGDTVQPPDWREWVDNSIRMAEATREGREE